MDEAAAFSIICSLGEEPVKDYKRSLQRQVSDDVLQERASKKWELTQTISHSLR